METHIDKMKNRVKNLEKQLVVISTLFEDSTVENFEKVDIIGFVNKINSLTKKFTSAHKEKIKFPKNKDTIAGNYFSLSIKEIPSYYYPNNAIIENIGKKVFMEIANVPFKKLQAHLTDKTLDSIKKDTNNDTKRFIFKQL